MKTYTKAPMDIIDALINSLASAHVYNKTFEVVQSSSAALFDTPTPLEDCSQDKAFYSKVCDLYDTLLLSSSRLEYIHHDFCNLDTETAETFAKETLECVDEFANTVGAMLDDQASGVVLVDRSEFKAFKDGATACFKKLSTRARALRNNELSETLATLKQLNDTIRFDDVNASPNKTTTQEKEA